MGGQHKIEQEHKDEVYVCEFSNQFSNISYINLNLLIYNTNKVIINIQNASYWYDSNKKTGLPSLSTTVASTLI